MYIWRVDPPTARTTRTARRHVLPAQLLCGWRCGLSVVQAALLAGGMAVVAGRGDAKECERMRKKAEKEGVMTKEKPIPILTAESSRLPDALKARADTKER